MMLANDTVSIKISKVLNKNLKKRSNTNRYEFHKEKNCSKELLKTVRASKAHFLDAPVSGGTAGAKGSKLAIMVGGEKKIFNKIKNLFWTMGKATYVGKTGSGQVAKFSKPSNCWYYDREPFQKH